MMRLILPLLGSAAAVAFWPFIVAHLRKWRPRGGDALFVWGGILLLLLTSRTVWIALHAQSIPHWVVAGVLATLYFALPYCQPGEDQRQDLDDL